MELDADGSRLELRMMLITATRRAQRMEWTDTGEYPRGSSPGTALAGDTAD